MLGLPNDKDQSYVSDLTLVPFPGYCPRKIVYGTNHTIVLLDTCHASSFDIDHYFSSSLKLMASDYALYQNWLPDHFLSLLTETMLFTSQDAAFVVILLLNYVNNIYLTYYKDDPKVPFPRYSLQPTKQVFTNLYQFLTRLMELYTHSSEAMTMHQTVSSMMSLSSFSSTSLPPSTPSLSSLPSITDHTLSSFNVPYQATTTTPFVLPEGTPEGQSSLVFLKDSEVVTPIPESVTTTTTIPISEDATVATTVSESVTTPISEGTIVATTVSESPATPIPESATVATTLSESPATEVPLPSTINTPLETCESTDLSSTVLPPLSPLTSSEIMNEFEFDLDSLNITIDDDFTKDGLLGGSPTNLLSISGNTNLFMIYQCLHFLRAQYYVLTYNSGIATDLSFTIEEYKANIQQLFELFALSSSTPEIAILKREAVQCLVTYLSSINSLPLLIQVCCFLFDLMKEQEELMKENSIYYLSCCEQLCELLNKYNYCVTLLKSSSLLDGVHSISSFLHSFYTVFHPLLSSAFSLYRQQRSPLFSLKAITQTLYSSLRYIYISILSISQTLKQQCKRIYSFSFIVFYRIRQRQFRLPQAKNRD